MESPPKKKVIETLTFQPNEIIGQIAFSNCPRLNKVTFLGNATIGQSAFSNCPRLNNVIFSQGVTTIENEALCGLYAIQKSSWAKVDDDDDDVKFPSSYKQYSMDEIRKYQLRTTDVATTFRGYEESAVKLTTADGKEHFFTFSRDMVVIKWECSHDRDTFYNVNLIQNSLCEFFEIPNRTKLYRFAQPSRKIILDHNKPTFFAMDKLLPHFIRSYLNSFKRKYTYEEENKFNMYEMETTQVISVLKINNTQRRNVMTVKTDVDTFENILMASCLAWNCVGWIAYSQTDNQYVLDGGSLYKDDTTNTNHTVQWECALSNAFTLTREIRFETFRTIKERWVQENIITPVMAMTDWFPLLIHLRL